MNILGKDNKMNTWKRSYIWEKRKNTPEGIGKVDMKYSYSL